MTHSGASCEVVTDPVVSDEQVRSFKADGFVAISRFITGEELSGLFSNVDRFINEVVPGMPRSHVFYEDKGDPNSLKQLQHMGDHDPWFHALYASTRIRKVAEALMGHAVIPKNMQYFNKPPATGRPTPPHQDGYYFMLNPCEAVTMWLALDDVDEENGCVRYVRGSHRRGMRSHSRTKTLGFSQGITDYTTVEDEQCEVAIAAEPGDLLVHHALTIHRADGNRSSSRSRRALGFIYYSQKRTSRRCRARGVSTSAR